MSLDKRIRILVIVNSVFGYDGISNVATNYYRYQNKNKVKMDLLTINSIPTVLEQEIKADGNKHFIVPNRNINPIKYIAEVKRIVKKSGYDIVYVHGNSATMTVDLLGAKLAGCKVRVAHSHNTQCDHQKINKMLMPIFSKLYTDCCACSVEAGNFLFGNKECYVVNNGLYIPKYEFSEEIRNAIRKKYGIEDKIVIGHIGRFTYQKNQEFLISILAEMIRRGKSVVLLLVGGGETVEQIKFQAREAGVENKVIFYGTTECVNEVVQAMDCFVFPSRFEGLGIVALEAQASGLNCVASEQVPRKMKVNDGTTFLPLVNSVDKWIDAIEQCVVSIDERKKSREVVNNSFKVAGYDIEQNCVDMLTYYYRILREKGQ